MQFESMIECQRRFSIVCILFHASVSLRFIRYVSILAMDDFIYFTLPFGFHFVRIESLWHFRYRFNLHFYEFAWCHCMHACFNCVAEPSQEKRNQTCVTIFITTIILYDFYISLKRIEHTKTERKRDWLA